MDITLHVKRFEPKGEIFNVHLTSKLNHMTPGKNLYVHITGVPVATARKIKAQLTQQWLGPVLERYSEDGTVKRQENFGRQWRIPPSLIPSVARARLLADRQITVTWVNAKPLIRNMKRNAQIVDADLEADPDDVS